VVDYSLFSKEELSKKIKELETLLDVIQAQHENQELLKFAWIGNLGNWYWYIKSNRVICNASKFTVLGYSKEEIPTDIGFEFFTDKLHPDDYNRVMDDMRSHLQGKVPVYETMYRIKTKDGQWMWFYDRGKITRYDENGKPELIEGIVFDITEQKKVEKLLEDQNQKLLEMSTTDYLTKVYNRRALHEKLDYEIRRCKRKKNQLSVVMLDIDNFKKINDTHGHLTGDKVIVQVARIISKEVRNIDIVGRYGGEEFLLILPDCSFQNGYLVAERIRSEIQDFVFEDNIKVTISGGVAQYEDETAEALIDSADKYMYQAKKKRNRIVIPAG
jgi:diguanylate cyclase